MKPIDKSELFENLGGFLKSKGVELKEGSYTRRIRRGCDLLADVVNTTQHTMARAKVEVDRKLGQLRQCIHQATAPKAPPAAAPPPASGTAQSKAGPKAGGRPRSKAAPAKRGPARRPGRPGRGQ